MLHAKRMFAVDRAPANQAPPAFAILPDFRFDAITLTFSSALVIPSRPLARLLLAILTKYLARQSGPFAAAHAYPMRYIPFVCFIM